MMLKYRNGNLFDAPKNALLVHACNAKGVWGSGIAAEFKKRFPKSYEEYRRYCERKGDRAVGTAFRTWENVVCLITSRGYGSEVDSPEEVLRNTERALSSFLDQLDVADDLEVHSNKFNSGLFRVPWEQSEGILRQCLKANTWLGIEWTVWDNSAE